MSLGRGITNPFSTIDPYAWQPGHFTRTMRVNTRAGSLNNQLSAVLKDGVVRVTQGAYQGYMSTKDWVCLVEEFDRYFSRGDIKEFAFMVSDSSDLYVYGDAEPAQIKVPKDSLDEKVLLIIESLR